MCSQACTSQIKFKDDTYLVGADPKVESRFAFFDSIKNKIIF
jgi:hypothetical protein